MSNKAHLRPHPKKRHASWIARLLVVILFIAIFALSIALAASGRGALLVNLRLLSRGRVEPALRSAGAGTSSRSVGWVGLGVLAGGLRARLWVRLGEHSGLGLDEDAVAGQSL